MAEGEFDLKGKAVRMARTMLQDETGVRWAEAELRSYADSALHLVVTHIVEQARKKDTCDHYSVHQQKIETDSFVRKVALSVLVGSLIVSSILFAELWVVLTIFGG